MSNEEYQSLFAFEGAPLRERFLAAADDRLRAFSGPSLRATSRTVPVTNPWGEPLSFPVVDRARDTYGAVWLRVLQ